MILSPGQILRLLHIQWVLVRHGLDDIILATHLFRPVRFLRVFSPSYWLRRGNGTRAERLRRALEELGPIFVKFGQALSTRPDLLPEDIARELARLQDAVPPFPGADARRLIERALGRPVGELFAEFDERPLASASVAQVHAARLQDGREVVVKVLRPGIERIIRRDVGLLYIVADLAQRYWSEGHRLRPREVVAEYERTILDELDLLREAANASQLRRNFEGHPGLYVPEVHWPLSRKSVLVLERVWGTPVSDIARLREQGIDLVRLSELGVEVFFTQVFRHNFFHADMHPGNIFVTPAGNYIALDFGIVGALSAEDQRYLAENFVAFFRRDYRRVAELHVQSGWAPPGTRVDQFEAAIRTVCEPIFERPLKDISFGVLLVRLFQTARRFDMEIQPQLVLLQKTLLNIEGLGRQLNPELDLWRTAKPFLERWLAEQVGTKAFLRGLRRNLPVWFEKAPEIPGLLHKLLTQSVDERQRTAEQREIARLRGDVRRLGRSLALALGGGALVIAGALWLTVYGMVPDDWRLVAGGALAGLGLGGLLSAWRGR